MGCTQSKVIEDATDVYRPAPTSFALFDINSVEEPWIVNNVKCNNEEEEPEQQQQIVVHVPILDKLDKLDDGAHSWSEVSKALEDLKPSFHNNPTPLITKSETLPNTKTPPLLDDHVRQLNKSKSSQVHTLEELDSKLSSNMSMKTDEPVKKKSEPQSQPRVMDVPPPAIEGIKPLTQNLFIMKDRLEREREGKKMVVKFRRDPLSDYPEKCPPGGSDSVVLYTTTLRGVRRTFEDCTRARSIIDGHRVVIDERNVSLHGEFLNELRELLGEGVSVPRLFVKGRYIGGVDEVVELNETSRLNEILNSVGKNNEIWDGGVCEGCGGARFVPCLECGGSCKVVIEDKKERCAQCNENGLIQCPLCH